MSSHLLLALAVGLFAEADDASSKAKAKDLAAIQGVWQINWIERDGEKTELDEDGSTRSRGTSGSKAIGR